MIEKIRKVKLAKGLCVATALVAMFFVWGCDDSDHVAEPTPAKAKYVTVTGTVGAAGGSVTATPEDTTVGEAMMTVPAGALDGNVTFTVMYAEGTQIDQYPEKSYSATDQPNGGTFKSAGFMSVFAKDAQGNPITNLGEGITITLIVPPGATDANGHVLQAGDNVPVWAKDYGAATKVKFTPPCNGKWTLLGSVTITQNSAGKLVVSFQVNNLCTKKLFFSAQWLIGGTVEPTGPTGTGGTGGTT